MNLLFDPSTHTYHDPETGRVIVNVTRALGLLSDFSKVDPTVLENARQEGVDMHRMMEIHFLGDLDEATLPEWLVPRLAALKRFAAETQFECMATEQRLYDAQYDYAGTTDLIGRMTIAQGRKPRVVTACIDLKRSFAGGRLIGWQTAAYAHAWNLQNRDGQRVATHRYALKLHANGDYRLEPFTAPNDFGNFLTCLSFYRLREELK